MKSSSKRSENYFKDVLESVPPKDNGKIFEYYNPETGEKRFIKNSEIGEYQAKGWKRKGIGNVRELDPEQKSQGSKNPLAGKLNGSNNGIPNNQSKKTESRQKTPFEIVEDYILTHYELMYNEISNQLECRKLGEPDFIELNIYALYRELEREWIKISVTNLEAILKSDFVPVYNPFKEYFESLPKWTPGIDTDYIEELANHVKAIDQSDFNYHLRKMLVRSVACALDENTFNKHAFILVGRKQNTGKSTFIRNLCPKHLKKYMYENISTIDKDSLIALSEAFIINEDELAMLGKAEINQLKAFLSRDQVKIRHPYDKTAKLTPRRANFFGSTNKDEFLNDETGSVRWLCFVIEYIDFAYSDHVKIDSVWAQAFALYKSGFEFQLTPADIERNEERNRKHQKLSVEMELIPEYFRPPMKDENEGCIKLTSTQILKFLEMENPTIRNMNINNIGKALVALDFEQHPVRLKGISSPKRVWYLKILEGTDITTLRQFFTIQEDVPF